jgi:hypothetical protein
MAQNQRGRGVSATAAPSGGKSRRNQKFGLRFSTKALMPSVCSSLAITLAGTAVATGLLRLRRRDLAKA